MTDPAWPTLPPEANYLRLAGPGAAGTATTVASAVAWQALMASQEVAFGDMPNDVPMLLWAGHGVAMGNAHPEAVAAANEVTESNDDDGLARVLERWWT